MPNSDQAPRPADCVIVIFGASGDLTKRKLMPALYHLWERGMTPKNFAILGVARSKYEDEAFRQKMFDFKPEQYPDAAKWAEFSKLIHYEAADSTAAAGWPAITSRVKKVADAHAVGSQNVMFYVSMAPQFFEPIINQIGDSGLVVDGKRVVSANKDNTAWQRIVVEKPFGSDPASARSLNETLSKTFFESSIYRIDHYLGKELV